MKILEDYNKLVEFFTENQQVFKKHRNTGSKTGQHSNNMISIRNKFNVDFPYGYCFPLSQFLFYFLGDYESDYNLKCIRKIPLEIDGSSFTTSHWYVQSKDEKTLIDLSKRQFDKIINIEEYYIKGRRANFGQLFITIDGEKTRFDKVVPCKQVRQMYSLYRDNFGPLADSNKLEYFYKLENKISI